MNISYANDAELNNLFDEIDNKADIYEKFKSLLEGNNRTKRLAAFEIMTSKGDDTLKELAINTAFFSSDDVLRARALKIILFSRSDFVLELNQLDPSNDTNTQIFIENSGVQIPQKATHYDFKNNCIGFRYKNDCSVDSLSVSGLSVGITSKYHLTPHYAATMTLNRDGLLVGTFSHAKLKKIIPVTMKVY